MSENMFSFCRIVYRLRVRQLERQGKPYRPIDFALSLNVDTDDEGIVPVRGRRSASVGSGLGSTFQN